MFGKKEKETVKLTIEDVEIEGSIDKVFKLAKDFHKVKNGLNNYKLMRKYFDNQQQMLPPAQPQWNPNPNQHQGFPMQQQPIQQQHVQQPVQPQQQQPIPNYPLYANAPVNQQVPQPQMQQQQPIHNPVAQEAIAAPKQVSPNKRSASKKPQDTIPQQQQQQFQQQQPMQQQMQQVPDEIPDLEIPVKGKTRVKL